MGHKTIQGERGTFHYWVAGTGAHSIIFSHEATADQGLYPFQMEHFAQGDKAISRYVPLHRQSRPYRDFSLQNAANELIAILDAEKIKRTHLVGQSMGG
ncbi:MAG: alpha/beta hydrolase [Anaerolineaceae bacterium]|nr:alpha/beta hydrolase [Anaerolineaceae bacterium]MBN2677245.1 alpha/beta hydrolase [Anaerolineaceae bacterium]